MYKTVELFDEPNQRMKEFNILEYSEMTLFQQSFICGLIKENRPGKIVEVGVSAGGTTAVILSCLEMLKVEAEMYSVDLSNKWYRNIEYETGHCVKNIFPHLKGNVEHKFLLGGSIPFFLEQIGGGIDFLILDTAHILPGELLDFIVCLPFLKDGCIVIIHDTIKNHIAYRDGENATKLLFDVVKTDDKYYMPEKEINVSDFSNIAAFRVSEETRKGIRDLFSVMTATWGYLLEGVEKEKYRETILSHYKKEYLEFFDRIELLQRNTYLSKKISENYGIGFTNLKKKCQKCENIVLYGAGNYADIYYQWGKINHLNMKCFVISDNQEKVCGKNPEIPIYFLSELPYGPEECSFILALDKRHFIWVIKNLHEKGYDRVL